MNEHDKFTARYKDDSVSLLADIERVTEPMRPEFRRLVWNLVSGVLSVFSYVSHSRQPETFLKLTKAVQYFIAPTPALDKVQDTIWNSLNVAANSVGIQIVQTHKASRTGVHTDPHTHEQADPYTHENTGKVPDMFDDLFDESGKPIVKD